MLSKPEPDRLGVYREVFYWQPAPEQIEAALDVIKPAPELREQCGQAIGRAFRTVRFAKKVQADARSPKEQKQMLGEKVKPRKASQRRDTGKQIATFEAHDLIENFGSSPPSLTQGGPWDKLAAVLFENTAADLFGYLPKYRQDCAALARLKDLLRG